MPLKRKTQFAVAVEDYPGAAVSFAGTDVIDTIEPPEFSGDPELLTREPSGGTLSRSLEAVGRFTGQITAPVDLKGSGTATTAPRWSRMLLASLAEQVDVDTMALSVSLAERLEPGDVLTGGTSGARAIVVQAAAAAAIAVKVVVLSGTFATTEVLSSVDKGAAVGTTHGTTVLTAGTGLAWKPVSDQLTQVDTTGAWSGSTPAAGKGLDIMDGATIVGMAHFVSWSTGTLVIELAWGVLAAGYDVVDALGSSITIASPANVTALTGQSVAARMNLDKLILDLTNARTTFQITAEAGGTGRIEFTVQGQPASATEGARLTASGLATTTPPRFAGGVMSLKGVRIPTKSVTFDAGADLQQIADANSTNGEKGGDVTGRTPTVQVTVEQGALVGLDVFALRDAGTLLSWGIQIGTAAGNSISICGASGQISAIAFGDDNGIATWDITLQLRRFTDTGDDEWFVAHN
jgi:hypothetical protein